MGIFKKIGKKAPNFLPKNSRTSGFLIVFLKSKTPKIAQNNLIFFPIFVRL
jgi:hypothetical protein